MGYCINFKDVEGKEISNGVTERVLLSKENTGDGPRALTVKHYILEKGDILELSKNGFEKQDYDISGSVFFKSTYMVILLFFLQILPV